MVAALLYTAIFLTGFGLGGVFGFCVVMAVLGDMDGGV